MPGVDTPPAATINVATVSFDGELPLFKDSPSMVADLMIHNHYERDGHRYVAGLTSPEAFNGSKVGIVQVAALVELWVSEWTSSNVGEHPPVPDPTPPSGWVLLDTNATLVMIGGGPGGDPVFRIEGTYVYANLNPSDSEITALQSYVYPYAPWLEPDGVPRTVPATKIFPDLIQPSTGGGGDVGPGTTGGTNSSRGGGLTNPVAYAQ